MMKQLPKVVFFGNERLATGVITTAPTLQALVAAGWPVAAVILNNETAVSRSSRPLEIAAIAKTHNIPVIYPSKLNSGQIAGFGADVGVLVAYGKIIPESIIDLFPAGIVNIHPSLLPKHRGPTPIESVILEGETETGVSLMKLAKQMDAGPVYAQRTTLVPGKITKQDLTEELQKIGSELLIKYLPDIVSGSLTPKPQNEAAATYDSLISKTDSVVDWTKPAAVLERQVRAYSQWPKTTATIGSQTLIIIEADVIRTSGKPGEYAAGKKELVVYCGQNSLKITRVQPVNKKEMPVQAFLAGYTL